MKPQQPLGATAGARSPVEKRGHERWPTNLLHAELCAWRFGGTCDCGLNRAETERDSDAQETRHPETSGEVRGVRDPAAARSVSSQPTRRYVTEKP
jgi:hypothetical protein